jgi:hypothetical protein
MQKTQFTAVALVGSLLLFGLPALNVVKAAELDTVELPGPGTYLGDIVPSTVPQQGTATYVGTFALAGGDTNRTGSITISVDFTYRKASADLTIPSLGSPSAPISPPIHYTPSGYITMNRPVQYVLLQGVPGSNGSPFISITGTFSGGEAPKTLGTFFAGFIADTGGAINVTGTFSGKRGYLIGGKGGAFQAQIEARRHDAPTGASRRQRSAPVEVTD